MTRTFIGPLLLEQPLEIDDARRASFMLAQQRRNAEDVLKDLVDDAAEKERVYRKRLAQAFVEVTEGSAAHREAEAKSRAADAAYDRDLAAGSVKAQTERLRGLEGERAMLQSLISWSKEMRLDDRERLAA